MDSSAPAPLNNSFSTKMNQVIPFKPGNMHRLIQMVQRVAQKSCRRACQLFCSCPVDALLCERPACSPAQDHGPTVAKTTQAVALTSPPSTILILNISNSTLIDCVIGNDTYASAVAECQPLMEESSLHMHDQRRCSCRRGHQGPEQMSPPPSPGGSPLPSQELPRINIHGSHLNYVIIGDNNYMHAEPTHLTETEEAQM